MGERGSTHGGLRQPWKADRKGRDVVALSDSIAMLLGDADKRASMSRHARAIAEQEYSLSMCAQRYVDLYQTIL